LRTRLRSKKNFRSSSKLKLKKKRTNGRSEKGNKRERKNPSGPNTLKE